MWEAIHAGSIPVVIDAAGESKGWLHPVWQRLRTEELSPAQSTAVREPAAAPAACTAST